MPHSLPVLSIFGPTGVGKTAVAFTLAEQLLAEKKCLGADLISADSRQVYADIPILSGADIPEDMRDEISLHGIGFLEASESWSLGEFQSLFFGLYEKAVEKKHAVIVVGGTALYHRQLLQSDPRLRVQPNEKLREELAALSLSEVQEKVQTLNPERWQQMNESDKANPRRLHRAIEQELAVADLPAESSTSLAIPQKFLSVVADQMTLEARISQRVRERFETGAVTEVKQLLELPHVAEHVLTACGVEEITTYLRSETTEAECIENWTKREIQYTKAQQKWKSQFPHALQLDTTTDAWRDDLLSVIESVY